MPAKKTPSEVPEKKREHSVKFYLFPGITPEAKIAGDLHLDDVSCPYCNSGGYCAHLLALIDPLNYSLDGRASGLDEEFSHRIRVVFLRLLSEGKTELAWKSDEMSELWEWAEDNWSDGDEEVEIDEIVLFRLLTAVLEEVSSHADYGSILEGFGVETEYTIVYDDDPVRVVDEAVRYLDRILIPSP
jgi:hypothetical protein